MLLVTVCGAASFCVHVTVVPLAIVNVAGVNANPLISTLASLAPFIAPVEFEVAGGVWL